MKAVRFAIVAVLLAITVRTVLVAAVLPTGFSESMVAGGLGDPTAMAFAPDGRLFVTTQSGKLRVIKNGALLPASFLTLNVDPNGERGLLGVAFDPNFASNQFIYVYYTVPSSPPHNRVSRFKAAGDTAVAGSETILLELNNLSSATNHNGGALHFGHDGKLYIGVGENANPLNAQMLNNLLGKMLRINTDPAAIIPADNPFFQQAADNNRAIWALGLRNPYTFAFDPFGARMLINDVGQNAWEEVNEGVAGSNYGWPNSEGYAVNANERAPIYAYGHGSGAMLGCAITGGTFYNPGVAQFPSQYYGMYFFADYCGGWINLLDPANPKAVKSFASNIPSPVDLQVGPDGNLYYLARGSGGFVSRIFFTGSQAPGITQQPASQTVPSGQPATFTVGASGTLPLNFQWQRNQVNLPGATSSSYTIAAVAPADSGARFRAVVTNAAGAATSNEATLTVTTQNTPPTPAITQPAQGALYSAGDTIAYAGTGSDIEDGASLPASAFTWQVDFHHDTHVHPFLPATTGARSGSFTIPRTGETSANVWYRIYLTVTDSQGLKTTTSRDVRPRTVAITLTASAGGLQLTLDGQPVTAPYSFTGVVGMFRTIGAPTPQTLSGWTYRYQSWSDGGSGTHQITTPSSAGTYTAQYRRKRH